MNRPIVFFTSAESYWLSTSVTDFNRCEEHSGTIQVIFSWLYILIFPFVGFNRFVDTGEMPEAFPYRTKALFAFEEIDGVDVCFFGMHVQEYGSECPFPNTRSVHSIMSHSNK